MFVYLIYYEGNNTTVQKCSKDICYKNSYFK